MAYIGPPLVAIGGIAIIVVAVVSAFSPPEPSPPPPVKPILGGYTADDLLAIDWPDPIEANSFDDAIRKVKVGLSQRELNDVSRTPGVHIVSGKSEPHRIGIRRIGQGHYEAGPAGRFHGTNKSQWAFYELTFEPTIELVADSTHQGRLKLLRCDVMPRRLERP